MHRNTTKYISILLIQSIMFYACTSTIRKPEYDRIESFYSKINAYGEYLKAVIVLNNEESIFVKDLHIENDTTSYVSVNNNEFNTINSSRIHFIEFRDATTGAIGGLTIGIISGLAVALVSIVLFMNEEGGHPNTGPLVALIYGPILGGVIGTITGAIREDRKIFTINTEK